MATVHETMIQPVGPKYRDSQIEPWSYYREPIDQAAGRAAGNSHVWGDASPEVQSQAIDALIAASERAGLNPRQTAHVLAIARAESGFNPDAAAGTTSAYGLGQFVDDTGKAYGLNDGTRGNLDKQADALVSHYLDNAALAKSRGEGEDFVYKYHHDGPARDYGGLAIGKDKVTPYIDDYETFVREHQRERGFAAPEQPAERASGTRQSRAADADGVLRQGESGPSVKALQEQLNRLGVTDAQGRPLQADGDFGPSTRQAVEAFQRSQPGLDADGIAGRDTLNALKSAQPQQAAAQPAPAAEAAPAPLLSDRAHPDNAMYRQAVAGLEKLGPQAGFADRQALERAAGVLTYEARVSGLNRIDHVVQSADGSRLFAVQGELQDPAHHRVVADKAQAVGQSVEQSTRQLSQDAPSPASQSAEQQTQSARPVMG